MNLKIKFLVPVIAIVSAALPSCKTHKSVTAANTESNCATIPTYMADVKPIIDENCGNSCHSSTRKAHQLDLTTFDNVKAAASDKSFLGAINHEEGFEAMPRNHPKLDDASIQKITCWIKGGMN